MSEEDNDEKDDEGDNDDGYYNPNVIRNEEDISVESSADLSAEQRVDGGR